MFLFSDKRGGLSLRKLYWLSMLGLMVLGLLLTPLGEELGIVSVSYADEYCEEECFESGCGPVNYCYYYDGCPHGEYNTGTGCCCDLPIKPPSGPIIYIPVP